MLQAPCLKTVAGRCFAAPKPGEWCQGVGEGGPSWVPSRQWGCHMSNVNTASLPVRSGPSW